MTQIVDITLKDGVTHCPVIHEVESFGCPKVIDCPSKNCILKGNGKSIPSFDVELDKVTKNLIVYCYHGAKK